MKEIPLSNGGVTVVDDADFSKASTYKWRRGTHGYATRSDHARKMGSASMSLHRFIIDAPSGTEVDHINGDPLDNRRANLRLCNHAQNMRNIKRRSDNTSGYRGVSWDKNMKKWIAKINFNKAKIFIGFYDSVLDAAQAYDKKAHELFGEFARTNF